MKRFAIEIKVLLCFVTVTSAFAGIGIFFDPASLGVTNRVVRIELSVDSLAYQNRTNVAVLMEWQDVLTNPASALKWTGSEAVLLTSQEQTTIANAEASAAASAALAAQQFRERAAKTNAYVRLDNFLETDLGRLMRAQLEVLVDEINALRTQQAVLLMELNKAKSNITNWRSEAAFATNGWGNRTMGQARTGIINKLDGQADNN